MKKKRINSFFAILAFLFLASPLFARNIPGGHRGDVSSLIHCGETALSVDHDGFLLIWSVKEKTALERFQLTFYEVTAMVKHPLKDEICIIETGGADYYRITVWDYALKRKKFSIKSERRVSFINYSANGSYLITSGLDGSNLTLLDSDNGNIVLKPAVSSSSVSLAVTGRAEKNMLVYISQSIESIEGGQILYIDLESASVSGSFSTTGELYSPVIFGNNRFLAGISYDGLLVIDAASGSEYSFYENIKRSALLFPAQNGFYCLDREKNSYILYLFNLDSRGSLVVRQKTTLSSKAALTVSSIAFNESVVLASQNNVFIMERQGAVVPFVSGSQTRVMEIANTENNIALLTENNDVCFIPLDYNLLEDASILPIAQKTGFSRITPVSIKGEDHFILWNTTSVQYAPQLLKANEQFEERRLNFLVGRFPLRSISASQSDILVMDTAGNISVRKIDNIHEKAGFSFSSIGAIDAAFADERTIVVGRSVISGNSPLLFVNISTTETVNIPFPAQAGVMVYAGISGKLYAASVHRNDGGAKTKVIKISPSSGIEKEIFEYPGEDPQISLAESAGALAISCSGEGAAIYDGKVTAFERTGGLPVKLSGSGNFFLCLDSEGSVCWHDNKTGKLLAVFRLHKDNWTLSGDREKQGGFSRR